METFCLDSNVFIEAKNGPYGFDIIPGFWKWIDDQSEKSILYSTKSVYNELVSGSDELSKWIKERKDSNLFKEPNNEIQNIFTQIANYVVENYASQYSEVFLSGADPWVIAHAKIYESTVVTREKFLSGKPKKIKIPNICQAFDVPYIDTFELLRKTGAQFN